MAEASRAACSLRVLRLSAAIFSVGIFFLIYWLLPNRKLPVRAVLPTAIVTGLLWEGAKRIYVFVLPWLGGNFSATNALKNPRVLRMLRALAV